MDATAVNQAPPAPRELHLTRTFNAPRELVWQAWTDPVHLAAWWGPAGWTNPVCEIDVRPGGRVFIEMKGPEPWGSHPMGGTVEEVTPPERLVFISRAFGNDTDGWQLENRNTITLLDLGDKTELRLDVEVITASAMAEGALHGMREGWSQSLSKLALHLAGKQHGGLAPSEDTSDLAITLPTDTSIRITRTFKAPPELLYAVCTQPEHLLRWWGGCAEIKMLSCDVDLRVGGGYRFVVQDPSGGQVGFHGTYLELVPGQRVKQTFVYEPFPDAEAVETAVYEAVPGGTRLTIDIQHKAKESRDGHYYSGMEHGMRASYRALDELLEAL